MEILSGVKKIEEDLHKPTWINTQDLLLSKMLNSMYRIVPFVREKMGLYTVTESIWKNPQ